MVSPQDRERSPVLTATRFAAFWWAVVLGGGMVLLTALRGLEPTPLADLDAGLWVAVGLILAGELRPVVTSSRGDPGGINLATAFCFAVLLRYGLDVAVVVAALATALGELTRWKPPHRALFNVGQYVLSYAAAGAVLAAFGRSASASDPAVLAGGDLGVVLLAALAYHAANVVLVGTAVGWLLGTGWWDAVTEDVWWHTATTAAVMALAPLVVTVAEAAPALLPLLVLPLVLLWWTAKESLAREHAAETDPLTGLTNRKRLAQVVDEVAAGPRGTVVLCLLDLDRFKQVNDTFGHAVGDVLLREVADRLRSAVREGDTVARLGGDEFVLILDLADVDDVEASVLRVAEQVRTPIVLAGTRLEVEMSVGVAVVGEHGRELDTLLRHADAAMYAAKSTGEVVRVFSEALERRGPVAATALAELRDAVDAGRLVLHYQPQVEVRTGAVRGVEALLRWQHPTRGLLLPGEFLPVARRTATMRSITGLVLDLAAAQAAAWGALGWQVPIAINASAHDLADPSFIDHLDAVVARHDLPVGALRVELTEDALDGDLDLVRATLRALEARGVPISLDDFGVEASSLARLRRVPFDEVKIDRSLVADLASDRGRDRTLVRAIARVTAELGACSVAEGVETRADWDAVAALGVDVIQGWGVARPMAPEDTTRWLEVHLWDGVLPALGATGVCGGDR